MVKKINSDFVSSQKLISVHISRVHTKISKLEIYDFGVHNFDPIFNVDAFSYDSSTSHSTECLKSLFLL